MLVSPYDNLRQVNEVKVNDPLNFWALNANNSKTVKATDLKFDVHVSRDSPDITH